MEKTISVTDLQLIPELAHLRMIDFIDPRNDLLIYPYLRVLGFDTDFEVDYIPSQHRNLQGNVVIAYQIVGSIECNDRFLSSDFATIEDRIIAAGYKDLGLANQLSQALSRSRDVGNGQIEGFPAELANPDEDAILEQIDVLANLLNVARPNRYKEDGSLKTLKEYHTPEVVVVKKERKKRSVAN